MTKLTFPERAFIVLAFISPFYLALHFSNLKPPKEKHFSTVKELDYYRTRDGQQEHVHQRCSTPFEIEVGAPVDMEEALKKCDGDTELEK